jgi:hypothetical protein
MQNRSFSNISPNDTKEEEDEIVKSLQKLDGVSKLPETHAFSRFAQAVCKLEIPSKQEREKTGGSYCLTLPDGIEWPALGVPSLRPCSFAPSMRICTS